MSTDARPSPARRSRRPEKPKKETLFAWEGWQTGILTAITSVQKGQIAANRTTRTYAAVSLGRGRNAEGASLPAP